MNPDKKIIIGITAALVILVGIIVAASPNGSENNQANVGTTLGASALTTDEPAFDFGTVSMSQGTVKHTFKIKNASAEQVKVAKIYTSCMCTTATLKRAGDELGPFGMPGHGPIPKINQIFVPGEEAEVEVEFDPAAHGPAGIGLVERSGAI